MKRSRTDLLNTIIENEIDISNIYNRFSLHKKDIIDATIKIDNCDLRTHQEDTLKQFEIWKDEFLENSLYLDFINILNNYNMNWTVKCYTDYDMKFYSNRLSVQLNNGLCFTVCINITNEYSPTMNTMNLSYGNYNIDMLKEEHYNPYEDIAEQIGITRNDLFYILGLFYFAFMFNPTIPSEVYMLDSNVSNIALIITELFREDRCKNDINFNKRYVEKDTNKRLKALEPFISEFNSLYEDVEQLEFNVGRNELSSNPIQDEPLEFNEELDEPLNIMPHIITRWYDYINL